MHLRLAFMAVIAAALVLLFADHAQAQLFDYGALTGKSADEAAAEAPPDPGADSGQPANPQLEAYGQLQDYTSDTMIGRTTHGVDIFRQRLEKTFARAPFVFDDVRQTLAAASPDGDPGYFVGVFIVTLLLLMIGRAVAILFGIYVGRPLMVGAQTPNPVGIAEKLPVLALRMGITLAAVLISVAVAVGLGLYFVEDNEATQKTAVLIIGAYALVLMIDTSWRMAISPYLPNYRIPPINDLDARRLYRWMSAAAAFGILSQAFSYWLLEMGLPHESYALIATALSAVSVGLILAMIWRNHAAVSLAILGGVPRTEASWLSAGASVLWAPLTALYFIAALVERTIRLVLGFTEGVQLLGGAFLALMLGLIAYAVTVYVVERVFARLRERDRLNREASEADAREDEAERIAAPDGAPPPDATELAAALEETPRQGMRTFEDLARRVASLFALGVSAYIMLRVWGGDSAFAEGTSFDTAQDIIDTLFFGYIAYHAVRIWIDRRIEEETGDVVEVEPGDEGGASAATRLATLLPLFRSFILITIGVTILLLVATELGVNVAPLFAGAGVVGLAIGFGAQTLVRDILSGVFFLTDDAFRKGEYIDVGDVKGTVEKISLRSFQLRHHLGALHTIPFGEIKHLTNFSRDWVMMKLPLRLTYDTDVEKVRKIIKKLGQELLEHPIEGPKFIQPLKSQGVYMMEESAMIIRVKYMTRPGDQWTTRKLVYSRIREVFAEHGIKFAHKEVTVRIPDLPEGKQIDEEQRRAIGAAARRAVEEEGEQAPGTVAVEGR